MKKLATVVFALLLTAGLSFAQNTGGDKKKTTSGGDRPQESIKTATKTSKGKKGHKGGKKGKKGSTVSPKQIDPPK